MNHECGCATFGPGPHPVDARHPNVRGCEHAEGLDVERLARALAHERAGVRTSWEGWLDAARALAAEYAARAALSSRSPAGASDDL